MKRKEWIKEIIYPILLKSFPDKYGQGIGGPYFEVIAIQSNYLKSGYHKYNILFKLEDLKRLRGFQITNDN